MMKKLSLNKETVSELSKNELNALKGGNPYYTKTMCAFYTKWYICGF